MMENWSVKSIMGKVKNNMLKPHEFYRKYANIPLHYRFTALDGINLGMTTIHDIYLEMQKNDEAMRPFILKQEQLLAIADKYIHEITL